MGRPRKLQRGAQPSNVRYLNDMQQCIYLFGRVDQETISRDGSLHLLRVIFNNFQLHSIWPQPPSHWTTLQSPLVPHLRPLLCKRWWLQGQNFLALNFLHQSSTFEGVFAALKRPSVHDVDHFMSGRSPSVDLWWKIFVLFVAQQLFTPLLIFRNVFFLSCWSKLFTCSTSHFAVGCFSMRSPRFIKWAWRQKKISNEHEDNNKISNETWK